MLANQLGSLKSHVRVRGNAPSIGGKYTALLVVKKRIMYTIKFGSGGPGGRSRVEECEEESLQREISISQKKFGAIV